MIHDPGNKIEIGPRLSESGDTLMTDQYSQSLIDSMVSQEEAKDIIIGDLEKGNITFDQAGQIAKSLDLQQHQSK